MRYQETFPLKKMKTRLLMICVVSVMISFMTLFFATNNVSGYSYVPLDCKIQQEFGYFSKEEPFNPFSKEFTGEDSLELLAGCFRNSHPGIFQ